MLFSGGEKFEVPSMTDRSLCLQGNVSTCLRLRDADTRKTSTKCQHVICVG